MNRRTLLLSAGAATLGACASASNTNAARQTPLAAEFDAAVARLMANNFTPGLAVAVFTAGGTYARGFGVTDASTGERADADAAFYIASSTKPLTALALAILHQRGELDLDTTLAAYADDAPFPEAARAGDVRLRQMLSHTHGIENDPIGYRLAFSGQHDPETLWRLLAQSEANAEAPLGQFQYTNVGYNIATMLTDRQLGVRWQDLLDREVFAPLGMRRASARMSAPRAGGWALAKPHQMNAQGAPERIYLEKTDQTMHSAGGVVMSANDALPWLELMVRDGRVGARQIVAPEIIAATRARLAEVSAEFAGYQRQAYGLGWYHGPYRDQAMLHHFGGFAGFAAHISYIPALGVGVAAFANDSSVGQTVTHAFANYAYDRVGGHADADDRLQTAIDMGLQMRERGMQGMARDRASRATRAWTLTRPHAAYAGAYESDFWGRIEVGLEGEAITAQYGALRAAAEPFTQPDSMRVEFVPGQGEPILFQGEGEHPSALRTRNGVFERV